MREKHTSGLGLTMIGIAAIFLAGFFLLVVFGAQSYRGTVSRRGENMDTRALAAYLPTVVRGSDRAGAITLREDPVLGDVLVIADGESGYATHLYRFEGMLMEDYARIGAALSPERAQRIAATARFEVELTDKLIVVETDAGRVLIHPRSGGETA